MNLAGNSLFDLIENEDQDHEDETILSVQKVLQIIETSWKNEKLSPELLPNKMEYIDCMLEQISQMESNIEKLKNNDIRIEIHRMEIERIRYIITSYLRIRISKIEKFTQDILNEDLNRNEKYLSLNEMKYAENYIKITDSHLNKYLNLLASNLRNLDVNKKLVQPDLNCFVFLRAGKNVENVFIKDMTENKQDEFILDEGTQHILPYQSIAEFVKSGHVQLI